MASRRLSTSWCVAGRWSRPHPARPAVQEGRLEGTEHGERRLAHRGAVARAHGPPVSLLVEGRPKRPGARPPGVRPVHLRPALAAAQAATLEGTPRLTRKGLIRP